MQLEIKRVNYQKRKFTNALRLEKKLQLNFHRNTVRTHESLFMCKIRRAQTRDKTSNSLRYVIISKYVQFIFGKLDKLRILQLSGFSYHFGSVSSR